MYIRIDNVKCKLFVSFNTSIKYHDLNAYKIPAIHVVILTIVQHDHSVPHFKCSLSEVNPTPSSQVLNWNEQYAKQVGNKVPYYCNNNLDEYELVDFPITTTDVEIRTNESRLKSITELLKISYIDELPDRTIIDLNRLAFAYGFNLGLFHLKNKVHEPTTDYNISNEVLFMYSTKLDDKSYLFKSKKRVTLKNKTKYEINFPLSNKESKLSYMYSYRKEGYKKTIPFCNCM